MGRKSECERGAINSRDVTICIRETERERAAGHAPGPVPFLRYNYPLFPPGEETSDKTCQVPSSQPPHFGISFSVPVSYCSLCSGSNLYTHAATDPLNTRERNCPSAPLLCIVFKSGTSPVAYLHLYRAALR
ncbi:Hypothetical protein NTJ_00636 [Nesidiocoris tenuis]|uniref:Uncharacterized protein n=1 Tax=Nesidiocoris tenuis TaxID=355587 RepID=A0ABN7A6U3_9HEMI|nr:Hypothetical protein NTJ_00636 [Nesidiocoris tenuis]